VTFTLSFGWIIVLIGITGASAQDGQEYVSKRVDAILATRPPNIKPDSTAARTYLYWLRAAGEVNICTDVDRLMRDRGRLHHSFGIGDPVKQALRRLPTDGVDSQAVKAIQAIPKSFDDVHSSMMSMPFIGIKEVAKELLHPVDAAKDDPTGVKMVVHSFTGIYSSFKDMHQIGASTDSDLETARLLLIKRYRFDLPKITLFEHGAGSLDPPIPSCLFSVDPNNQPPVTGAEIKAQQALVGTWKAKGYSTITFNYDGTADVDSMSKVWKYRFVDRTHVVAVGLKGFGLSQTFEVHLDGPSPFIKQTDPFTKTDVIWHRP
jgi:hypothetical protein